MLLDPPKADLTFFCLNNFVNSYAFRQILIWWKDDIMCCLMAITINQFIMSQCE